MGGRRIIPYHCCAGIRTAHNGACSAGRPGVGDAGLGVVDGVELGHVWAAFRGTVDDGGGQFRHEDGGGDDVVAEIGRIQWGQRHHIGAGRIEGHGARCARGIHGGGGIDGPGHVAPTGGEEKGLSHAGLRGSVGQDQFGQDVHLKVPAARAVGAFMVL